MYSDADASPSADGKPASDGYTTLDHDALTLAHDLLHWASELVNGVMERNRQALTMQMIHFLSEAKRDADLGERYVEMGEKYMEWTEGEKTA